MNETLSLKWHFFRLRGAIRHGDQDHVKSLIVSYPDLVETTDRHGWFPLHYAGYYGCVEILRVLLEVSPTVDAKDIHGVTPLHVAVEEGHVDAVNLLLVNGADPDILYLGLWTPLHLAAAAGHPEVVDELLRRDKGYLDAEDEFKMTPLHCAAENGNYYAVERLLFHGADSSLRDHKGRTATDVAENEGYSKSAALLKQHSE